MTPLIKEGISQAWGLLLKQYSSFTGIYIVTKKQLLQFVQLYSDHSGKMILEYRYPLEDDLIARPIIQTSGKYIGI